MFSPKRKKLQYLTKSFSQNEIDNYYCSYETKKFSYFFEDSSSKEINLNENYFDSLYFYEFKEITSQNRKILIENISNFIKSPKITSKQCFKKIRSNSVNNLKYHEIISFQDFIKKLKKIKNECVFDFFFILEFFKNSLDKSSKHSYVFDIF